MISGQQPKYYITDEFDYLFTREEHLAEKRRRLDASIHIKEDPTT